MTTKPKANLKDRSKSKVHTVYQMKNGTRVPGVTTIIGVLNKPALLDWAWKLGTEGIDFRTFRDAAASIGTLAHYLIMCDLSGQTPDMTEYSHQDIDLAQNCVKSWFSWKGQHEIDPILIEAPLVSENGFGGTIDCYCRLDGKPTLLDFKTGKAIYPEYFYQLAAYKRLLYEHKHPVDQVRILRIGRDADEGFEERTMTDLTLQLKMFSYCLGIYKLQRQINGRK